MNEHAERLDEQAQHLRAENATLRADLLREEVHRLTAENAVLRARIAEISSADEPALSSALTSRRSVLGLGAAVALGAVVGGAATVAPVAAVGSPITAGDNTVATGTTELRYQFPIGGNPRSHVLAVQDGVWGPQVPAATADPNGFRAAVGAYAGNDAILGGYFQTNSSVAGGAGARCVGVNANSYGLRAQGRKAALLLDRFDGEAPGPARLDPHVVGELVVDQNADLWFCVGAGSPGVWRKVAGPSTSGQLHLLGSPVRCYDSRDGYAPLGVVKGLVAAPRLVDCRVTLDGSAAVVPVDALGLVVNVTAVDTTGAGFLAVYPGGSSYPGTSLLNYGVGDTVANSTSVGCGPGATLTVRCGGGGVGHVIIDVMGYYR